MSLQPFTSDLACLYVLCLTAYSIYQSLTPCHILCLTGLPIQVRDTGLAIKDEVPKSDVNKEYYTQNMEREVYLFLVMHADHYTSYWKVMIMFLHPISEFFNIEYLLIQSVSQLFYYLNFY